MSKEKDTDSEDIANLFVKLLLEMKHVSTVTKLDNNYYQLLLFLDKDGFLYNSLENEHCMKNSRAFKNRSRCRKTRRLFFRL